jgi:hypothetical protein
MPRRRLPRDAIAVGVILLVAVGGGLLLNLALANRPIAEAPTASPVPSPIAMATPGTTAAPTSSPTPTPTASLPHELKDATWVTDMGDRHLAGILGGATLELPADEIGLDGRRGLVVSTARASDISTLYVRDIATGEVLASTEFDFRVSTATIGAGVVYVAGYTERRANQASDVGVWGAPLDGGPPRLLIDGDGSRPGAVRPRVLTSPSGKVVAASLCFFDQCMTDVVHLGTRERYRLEKPGGITHLADDYVVLIHNRTHSAFSFDGNRLWSMEFDGDIYYGWALEGSDSIVASWQEIVGYDESVYHVLEVTPQGTERVIASLAGTDAMLRLNASLSTDAWGVLMPGFLMNEAVEAGYVRLLDMRSGSLVDGVIPITD